MCECVNVCMYVYVYTYVCLYVWLYIRMDGCMGGSVDGWYELCGSVPVGVNDMTVSLVSESGKTTPAERHENKWVGGPTKACLHILHICTNARMHRCVRALTFLKSWMLC